MMTTHCKVLPLLSCTTFLRGLVTAAEGMQPRKDPRWYKEVAIIPNAVEV